MTPLITLYRKDGLSVLGEHFMQLMFRWLEDVKGDMGNDMPKLCSCAQEGEKTLVAGWKLVKASEGSFLTSVCRAEHCQRWRQMCVLPHRAAGWSHCPLPPWPQVVFTALLESKGVHCWLTKLSSSAHCICSCSLAFHVLICSRYQQHWLLVGRWKNTYLTK